jgi:hypothetical protein
MIKTIYLVFIINITQCTSKQEKSDEEIRSEIITSIESNELAKKLLFSYPSYDARDKIEEEMIELVHKYHQLSYDEIKKKDPDIDVKILYMSATEANEITQSAYVNMKVSEKKKNYNYDSHLRWLWNGITLPGSKYNFNNGAICAKIYQVLFKHYYKYPLYLIGIIFSAKLFSLTLPFIKISLSKKIEKFFFKRSIKVQKEKTNFSHFYGYFSIKEKIAETLSQIKEDIKKKHSQFTMALFFMVRREPGRQQLYRLLLERLRFLY